MILTMKRRRIVILLVGLLSLLIVGALVQIARYTNAERKMLQAIPPPNTYTPITGDGTNLILTVQSSAVPVLLQWSLGRDPVWIRLFDAIRKRLNLATPQQSQWTNVNQARLAFTVLRERGVSAVPELTRRLSDPDRDVRRYAVHMLGAIGRAIGLEAFHAMTNRLSDTDQEVRNDVVWALQFHPQPPAMLIRVYAAGLRDPFHIARENAIQGFVRLGTNAEPARDLIVAAQSDTDRAVPSIASNWLAKTKTAR
jgi:HEAT repeat protein